MELGPDASGVGWIYQYALVDRGGGHDHAQLRTLQDWVVKPAFRAVPGVEYVEMPFADHCCGSAGVYNVTQTDTALELLDEKMRHATFTQAQAIITANPGCLLQLRAGLALCRSTQAGKPVLPIFFRAYG